MTKAVRSLVLKASIEPRFLNRSTGDSLDSIPAIVGSTFLTVLAFWTPVALLAYLVLS